MTITILTTMGGVNAKQNEGYDLDSDARLRIGVKKRIPAKDCQLSKNHELFYCIAI